MTQTVKADSLPSPDKAGLVPAQPISAQQASDPNFFSNVTWAALVLLLANDPLTTNNVNNVLAWMVHENAASTWTGTAGVNNPLNNGLGSGGGSGLGSYPDLVTAAAYAAKGIEGGIFSSVCGGNAPGGIQAALQANAPFPVFKQAVIASGWASGCYSGWTDSSAQAVPTVTVAQAASHPSTNNPTVGNAGAALQGGGSDLQNILNVAGQIGSGPAQALDKAGNAIAPWASGLATLLSDVTSANWWKRVGLFSAGVVLIIGGVVLFISTTKTGQKAESTALEGAELGAIA